MRAKTSGLACGWAFGPQRDAHGARNARQNFWAGVLMGFGPRRRVVLGQMKSAQGTRPVKQIVFKGERLDLSRVRRWREKILKRI